MNTDDIKAFFSAHDQLAKHLGIELIEVTEGGAVAEMEIRPFHLNGVGTVHGGTLFSLADFVFAAASNSHGRVSVAINVSISFVKAATTGRLRAEGRETSLGPKISTYDIVVTDHAGDQVALFQGMAYRKRDTLPLTPP